MKLEADLPFVDPDFSSDLDMAPYLERVPDDAVCKGMFFHRMIQMVEEGPAELKAAAEIPRSRYLGFRDYPLKEHMELSARVVPRLYPELPSRAAFRRMGWKVYDDFNRTVFGRVIVGVLGEDFDAILDVAPKGIAQSISPGSMNVRKLDDRHWRAGFREIYGLLDTFYVGVIEGGFLHFGARPRIRVHLLSLSDGIFDITWEDPPMER